MKLTKEQEQKLKNLAKSDLKDFLIEYYELVKTEMADVRNTLDVPNEMQTSVRVAVCDIIDQYLIQRLKILEEDIASTKITENYT